MASTSRVTTSCYKCLASTAALPSTSRLGTVAAFSTYSSRLAAAESSSSYSSASRPSRPFDRNREGGGSRQGGGRQRPPRAVLPPYPEWISGPSKQYHSPKPGMGPNWIGETPFPMNPAFNPPPPIRQSVKNEIWALHASNPAAWTVRALSEKYSIGHARMEALLRLKALETEWQTQKKPLQTVFQANMDRLLGARDKRDPEPDVAVQSSGHSVRGPQYEEFHEAADAETPSILAPALMEEAQVKKSMIAALPSGGPELKGPEKTVRASSAPHSKGRPALSIVNVSGDSYKGAGRVERNQKRAEKRRSAKKAAASKSKKK